MAIVLGLLILVASPSLLAQPAMQAPVTPPVAKRVPDNAELASILSQNIGWLAKNVPIKIAIVNGAGRDYDLTTRWGGFVVGALFRSEERCDVSFRVVSVTEEFDAIVLLATGDLQPIREAIQDMRTRFEAALGAASGPSSNSISDFLDPEDGYIYGESHSAYGNRRGLPPRLLPPGGWFSSFERPHHRFRALEQAAARNEDMSRLLNDFPLIAHCPRYVWGRELERARVAVDPDLVGAVLADNRVRPGMLAAEFESAARAVLNDIRPEGR